jgi:hypothetical protein
MGNLPAGRTIISPPFYITGLDYCGPFQTKNKAQRRGPIFSTYVYIFVCFATKAIHLELVGDLTSEAFIAAFHAFVSRRGLPLEVYMDNATTFKGAHNIFLKLSSTVHEEGTNFKFIPPRAPHHGGLWESGVKSIKKLLPEITKGYIFTYEEFANLITRVEACVNSRPLTPISNDANDHYCK